MLRKRIRKLIKIVGVMIIIVAILILSVSYYLERHKEELFQGFEKWYTENYYGNLTLDDISISTYSTFPNVSLTLRNFAISDSITSYKSGNISFEKIQLFVSIKKIFKKEIQFKSLELKGGGLNFRTLKNSGKSERKLFSKRNVDPLSINKKPHNWFSEKDVKVLLENIKFSLNDHPKNKRITGFINKLNTQLSFNDSVISASVNMNIQMKELGLNLEKGTFLNDAELDGKFSMTFNKTKQFIEIPAFDLKIDEQLFKVKADIHTADSGSFDISLENDHTDLTATISLLTQDIQEKIENYTSSKPLYTYTEIKGGFEHGSNPVIKIACRTDNNDIYINENVQLKNVSFSGDFTNRIYKDERANLESKKDAQIHLNNLIATLNTISINLESATIFSMPETDTLTSSKEQPKWLSDKSTNIIITNGYFMFNDSIKNKRITGFVNSLHSQLYTNANEIHAVTDMDIQMKEMGLNLRKGTFFNDANLVGNFTSLYQKKKKHVTIPFFKLKIDKQYFNVKADISTEGLGSFNFVLENHRTNFKATNSLLSQNIQKKLKIYKVEKPLYTYTTISGSFEHGSNPLVRVQCKTQHNNITIKDKIEFKNVSFSGSLANRIYEDVRSKTEDKMDLKIEFNTLNADFEDISLEFKRAILLSTPEVKTYVDYEFIIKEPTTVLNTFFKNTAFIFTEGELDFKTSFKGDIDVLDSLYYNSQSKMILNKAKLIYRPLALEFPIHELKVEIINANGYLESLVIPLNETKNHLNFKGEIDNVVSLILDSEANVTSNLELYSENIIWKDFFSMFKLPEKNKTKNDNAILLNETLRVIRDKFNPQFDLNLDNFQYGNTTINNIISEVYFEQESLYMKKTGFNYGDGEVSMGLIFDISEKNQTLFDLDIEIENVDLENFLKEFNYFELSSLKEAKKVAGVISLNTEITGVIDEEKGLDTKSLKGHVNFDLRKLELNGFEPIQKIGDKIFKKKRFEDIRFADISEELYIGDRTVEIPRMEILSTAFDLFVEGHLNYDNKTNIWISVPLSNIKKRDLANIPVEKGFINAGNKVYIEIKENDEKKLEYKFHLNNKKLYEETGIQNQYREDHRKNRKQKNENKKIDKEKEKLMKNLN